MGGPWWQAWLVPERPGLRQFLLAAGALLLPTPALLLGPEWMLPAMVATITIGGGLGIGWSLTVGPTWLRRAPASAVGVLAIALACLAHLHLMPYWNLVLRAQGVRGEVAAWHAAGADPLNEPTYDCGPYRSLLQISHHGNTVVAHTPEPLQRWTPFGWQGHWYLLIRVRDGVTTARTLPSAEAMDRALTADGDGAVDDR